MFAVGTHDAMASVVHDSAPVSEGSTSSVPDSDALRRAIEAVGETDAVLSVSEDGVSVSAKGDALDAGYALGRLMAALAAEGLRASAPQATADGAAISVSG
jgi:hypothetical protein